MRYASVALDEKTRGAESWSRTAHPVTDGATGNNAVVHLANAVAAIGKWRAPIRLNDTTREFYTASRGDLDAEDAARYRAVIGADPAKALPPTTIFALHDELAHFADAAHIALPDDDERRLSDQRDPGGGEGHARHAHAPGRFPRNS